MIQYGFIEGMFKVKKSGLPDCTEEGMSIFRASQRMALKMSTDEFQEDDYLNIFQLYVAFLTRCNYFTTVEGVIVSRYIGEWLEDQAGFIGFILSKIWLVAEITFNAFDDAYILLTALMGWKAHMDFFNASVIAGRVLKICFAYWLEGLFFQGLNDAY